MKQIRILMWCVVLLLCQEYLHAQLPSELTSQKKTGKELLFFSLPDSFECNTNALHLMVQQQIDEPVNARLFSGLQIIGKVVNRTQHNSGSFSVNIRLENYHKALLNISVRLLADNSTLIQGRIVHPRYDDVLILYKNRDSYYFKKSLQRLYMPE